MSPLDSRILDINSESLGVSVEDLMENAGSALAETIGELFPDKKVLFVCGHGNNGGDGFVAARLMKADVMTLTGPKTQLAKKKAELVEPMPFDASSLKDYDVIVDCALGTGLRGELRAPYDSYVDAINDYGGFVVSCDIPSGLGTGKAVIPDVTVTFHDIKEGMDTENSGTIIIADIGIPGEAYGFIGTGDMLRYPVPKADSHKGQNGRLLIIGGGPYIGAPAMSALAALRIGTDLVHIATPDASFSQISSFSPTFIMHRLDGKVLTPDHIPMLLELSGKADAVLIGPGLGTDEGTVAAVREFISKCKLPTVVDADGITAVGSEPIARDAPLIFTPHHNEFKRLSGGKDVRTTAEAFGAVIVLKGKEDVITDGKRLRNNRTGSPGMTVGGTGDVLSGAIAGLLSKGMDPFDAGCLGAYICGRAGELSYDEYSYGMMPTDVIDNIARVLRSELR